VKFSFTREGPAFAQILDDQRKQLAQAENAAVKDAADLAVTEGRANIRSAGLPGRFATQLTKRFYANSSTGNPAALVYHKKWFSIVFERGATITGDLLWLPIEQNLPRGVNSPTEYGGKLVSVNVVGKPPMLFDAKDRLRGPLFVGVKTATIRKRLDLYRIFKEAAAHIPEFLERRMKGPE
jgi:Family of unknown function (DUF6441)